MNTKDTHAIKLYDNNTSYTDLFADGTNFAEALKVSNLSDIKVSNFELIGGWEDCIDCVRGNNMIFYGGILISSKHTKTFVTAKGGIDGFILRNIELRKRPKWFWDISLGDHTIYNDMGDTTMMKNVVIDNVWRDDNKKVTILCLWCERPELLNGNYKLIMVPKFLVKILFGFKRLTAKLFNKPHLKTNV